MTACDEVELSIERRARGAATAAELTAIDAHLPQCESCGRYAALVALRETPKALRVPPPFEHYQRFARHRRLQFVFEAVLLVLIATAGFVISESPGVKIIVALSFAGLGARTWATLKQTKQETALALLPVDESLRRMREALTKAHRTLPSLAGQRLVVGLACVAGMLWSGPSPYFTLTLLGGCALVGDSVYRLAFERPRLKRALDALNEA